MNVSLHASIGTYGVGWISGVVRGEDSIPVPGATVILSGLNKGAVTDPYGRFEFRNLVNGHYHLYVSGLGFESQNIGVSIVSGNAVVEVNLSQSPIQLGEVVVRERAAGFARPEKSLSVTTAGEEFFSKSPGLTVIQALQRIPGINSMDIGTGISKPVIRGLGFNRLVVAQNNIKQQGQQWGADHGLEIDPFGIGRVEVVKGPSSLLFGSDAIGGVLNIRSPILQQDDNIRTEVTKLARSNNDMFGGSAMIGYNRSGRFFSLRASYNNYADYRVPADRFVYNRWVMPIPDQRLENTSGRDLSFSLISGLRGRWGISTLTVSNFRQVAGFFPASHGIPNPDAFLDAGDRRTTTYPRQSVNHLMITSNTRILKGLRQFEVDFGFQQNHRLELNPPHVHHRGPLPDGNVELELVLNTFSANLRYGYQLSGNQNFLVGASGSLQENKRGGYNFLLPDFHYAELGLFAIWRGNISNIFYWNAGARADVAGIAIRQFQEPIWQDPITQIGYHERAPHLERNFFNFAFSGGLSWFISPATNLKVNFGRSFRNPTAIELAANGMHHGSFRHEMGDTLLIPEVAWQFDMGFTYEANDLYFHLTPFINYFSNIIFLNPSGRFSELPGAGQIFRFQQAEAIHLGGEIFSVWHVTQRLKASAGFEYVWAQNLDNYIPLPFTPPPALLAEVSYKLKNPVKYIESIRFLVSTRSVAPQNRVSRNEPPTGGYALVNTGVITRLALGRGTMDASLMVNNVFDKRYKNHISFYRILELPEPGRNVVLSVRLNLQHNLPDKR